MTFDASTPIVYTVIVDIGGQYNKTTGQFTCSKDGLYLFSVSGHSNGPWTIHRLTKNSNVITFGPYAQNTEIDTKDTGTSTTTYM